MDDKDYALLKRQLADKISNYTSVNRLVSSFDYPLNIWITGWDPEKPQKYEAWEITTWVHTKFLADLGHSGKVILYVEHFSE